MDYKPSPLENLAANVSHEESLRVAEINQKINESIFIHAENRRRQGWSERRIKRELKRKLG